MRSMGCLSALVALFTWPIPIVALFGLWQEDRFDVVLLIVSSAVVGLSLYGIVKFGEAADARKSRSTRA